MVFTAGVSLYILLLLCHSQGLPFLTSTNLGLSSNPRLNAQQKTQWPLQVSVNREQRMTPFWRMVGSKPLGAYCHQGLECTTKICRKGHCTYLHQYQS